MKYSIIRNCDKCGKEDNINCISGLCSSCEYKNQKIILTLDEEQIKKLLLNGDIFEFRPQQFRFLIDLDSIIIEIKGGFMTNLKNKQEKK